MAGDPDPLVCKLKCPLGNLATKSTCEKRSGGIAMWRSALYKQMFFYCSAFICSPVFRRGWTSRWQCSPRRQWRRTSSRRARRPWHSLTSSSPTSGHRPARSGTRRTGSRHSQHRPRWFLLLLFKLVSSRISDPESHLENQTYTPKIEERKKFHVWRDF